MYLKYLLPLLLISNCYSVNLPRSLKPSHLQLLTNEVAVLRKEIALLRKEASCQKGNSNLNTTSIIMIGFFSAIVISSLGDTYVRSKKIQGNN
jgi:hypothetical protein